MAAAGPRCACSRTLGRGKDAGLPVQVQRVTLVFCLVVLLVDAGKSVKIELAIHIVQLGQNLVQCLLLPLVPHRG